MKRICVNCGSSPGFEPCYMAAAQRLGQALVERNYELVYGGAEVGLMGRIADTVIRGGGVAIGVIPKSFSDKVSHQGLTELHVVDSMHERKNMMFNLSDAFIALPGGYGTIEEITEILTWAQLGFHSKPCGLINVDGYFDQLLSFFDGAVTKGFIKREHREMILVTDAPEDMLDLIESYRAPCTDKWVGVKTRN
jgi:uncharacterized protein (TIGR00730 family)